MQVSDEGGGQGGVGGGRMRLEENTKWIVGEGRGWLEVVVLTLHSFVYPPEPSNRPAVTQGLILLPLEA